ncbi:P-loop containing nucleoside triphosphate hydrolase protein [Phyllosticta citribraziliensis]
MAFSRPTQHLSPSTTLAVQKFVAIIDNAINQGQDIHALVKSPNRRLNTSFQFFVSLPSPTPVSYWPWMRRLIHERKAESGEELFEFSARTFELHEEYIDMALAMRKGTWYKAPGALLIPDPLNIERLPQVIRFNDERQYLAYVLGGHAYEYQAEQMRVANFSTGTHTCAVYPHKGGSSKYVILLSIRPGLESQGKSSSVALMALESDEHTLPQVGERVLMDITVDAENGQEAWTGAVIKVPKPYLKEGCNVAIAAERPPFKDGWVLEPDTYQADFFFGHHGQSPSPVRTRLIEFMTFPPKDHMWLFKLLLAHDNFGKNLIKSIIKPEVLSKINERCAARGLNAEQKQAVMQYFSQKISLVVGPGGTGKSTLVDTIVEIEASLETRLWVCTESNTAVDVLAAKFIRTRNEANPHRFFRVRTMFDEKLSDDKDVGQLTAVAQGFSDEDKEVQEILKRLATGDDSVRPMSLDRAIRERLHALKSGNHFKSWYDDEAEHLDALNNARVDITRPSPQGVASPSVEDLRSAEHKALRKLQNMYLRLANGVFSTAATASGPLLRGFKPRGLIMDEASQFNEASALAAILHALNGGKLERILLIGDHHQLPPTTTAIRNPFSLNSRSSLFERLILAGTPHLQLREQFRMHPSISDVVNKTIYGGTLIDHPSTLSRPGVDQFKGFVQALAKECRTTASKESCAVVISPTKSNDEPPRYPWGPRKVHGSTSFHNAQTAAITMHLCYLLISKFKFKAQDILIDAFYADQVKFYKALFAGFPAFNGIGFSTVDGSQGQEANIVIVDCVILGRVVPGGNMGFLGGETHRFNVGMSRARIGRITLCHERFADISDSPCWKTLLLDAQRDHCLFQDTYFHRDFEVTDFNIRFKDVSTNYGKRTQIGHRNRTKYQPTQPLQRSTTLNSSTSQLDHAKKTFADLTGADAVTVVEYLEATGGDLAHAVNRYFEDFPGAFQGEGEEIERVDGQVNATGSDSDLVICPDPGHGLTDQVGESEEAEEAERVLKSPRPITLSGEILAAVPGAAAAASSPKSSVEPGCGESYGTVSRAEHEALKKENRQLRKDLEDLRADYEQSAANFEEVLATIMDSLNKR